MLLLRILVLSFAFAGILAAGNSFGLMPQRVYAATLETFWSAGALVSAPLRFAQDDDGGGDDDDGGTGGNDDDDGAGGGGGGGGDDGGTPGGDPGGDGGGGFGDDDGGGLGGDDDGGFGDDDGPGGDDDGGPGGDGGDDDDGPRRGGGGSTFNIDAGDTFLAADPELTRVGPDEVRVDRDFLARKGQLVAISPSAESLRIVQSMGYAVDRRVALPAMGIEAVILSIPGNISAENALRAVRSRDPSGRYDYNHLYDFRLSTGASMRIKAEERSVRQALSRQRGFSIGIVDTPVDPQHPGLRGAQIVQRNFLGQGRAADPHHGTAVASILIDQRDGLLPAGRLFVASIFKESVRGDAIGAAVELAQAIDWMVAERVAVVVLAQRKLFAAGEWEAWFGRVTQAAPLASWDEAYASQAGLAKRHNTRAFLHAVWLNARINENTDDDVLLAPAEAALRKVP